MLMGRYVKWLPGCYCVDGRGTRSGHLDVIVLMAKVHEMAARKRLLSSNEDIATAADLENTGGSQCAVAVH